MEVPASFRGALERLETGLNAKGSDSGVIVRKIQSAVTIEVVTMDWNGAAWVNVGKEIITMDDAIRFTLQKVSRKGDDVIMDYRIKRKD